MSAADLPDWVTLAHGETVRWSGKPSPYLVKYWISVAAVTLLAGILALVWLLPPNWTWIGWLVIAAGLVVGVYAYVGYQTVRYVVTSEKLYKKTGIVRTDVETVRLDRVQNAGFSQTFLQRRVDCGDLTVVTAGTGTEALVFRSVPDPATVNGLLVDRIQSESGVA